MLQMFRWLGGGKSNIKSKKTFKKTQKHNMNKAIIVAFILSVACFSTALAKSQTQ